MWALLASPTPPGVNLASPSLAYAGEGFYITIKPNAKNKTTFSKNSCYNCWLGSFNSRDNNVSYPGPGWVFIILGLSILATEYVWANHLLKKAKDHYEKVKSKALKKKQQKNKNSNPSNK